MNPDRLDWHLVLHTWFALYTYFKFTEICGGLVRWSFKDEIDEIEMEQKKKGKEK